MPAEKHAHRDACLSHALRTPATGPHQWQSRAQLAHAGGSRVHFIYTCTFMEFKDAVHPFFESDTLLLECLFVLCLVVWRFFESRDV